MTLAEARGLAGIGQTELDELAGLTRGTVADLERGKNKKPSHEVVTRLVLAFQRRGLMGITAQELFPVKIPEGSLQRRTKVAR